MNPELWESIRSAPDPPGRIRERALQELAQRYHYDDYELGAVGEDALLAESARRSYSSAMNDYSHRRKIPRTIVLEFNRPGTRNKGQREAQ